MTTEQSDGFGVATMPGGAYFDVQAITTDYGVLPEHGAREFGFEYQSGTVVFYTRGVSPRPQFGWRNLWKSSSAARLDRSDDGNKGSDQIKGGSADEQVQRFYKVVPPQ